MQFLENNASFHDQYQKFGIVHFEKTPNGAQMIYANYPCYSPIFCASAFGYFLESILRHGGTRAQRHRDQMPVPRRRRPARSK